MVDQYNFKFGMTDNDEINAFLNSISETIISPEDEMRYIKAKNEEKEKYLQNGKIINVQVDKKKLQDTLVSTKGEQATDWLCPDKVSKLYLERCGYVPKSDDKNNSLMYPTEFPYPCDKEDPKDIARWIDAANSLKRDY